jgi:hypothetical protein
LHGDVLVDVLTHLGALVLVSEDLGLRFGGGTESGHFVFNTELVAIVNLVSVEVLVGGTVVQKDGLTSTEHFTLTVLEVSVGGLNDPHSVVHFLVNEADLLVAGEAGESEWGDGDTVEVEGLVHDLSVGRDADFLAEMNAIIG